jgi:hypothetical protein
MIESTFLVHAVDLSTFFFAFAPCNVVESADGTVGDLYTILDCN